MSADMVSISRSELLLLRASEHTVPLLQHMLKAVTAERDAARATAIAAQAAARAEADHLRLAVPFMRERITSLKSKVSILHRELAEAQGGAVVNELRTRMEAAEAVILSTSKNAIAARSEAAELRQKLLDMIEQEAVAA